MADKDLVLKLKLKAATLQELAAAFTGVQEAAKQSGKEAGKESGKEFGGGFLAALKSILSVRNIFKEVLSGDVGKLAERALDFAGKAAKTQQGKKTTGVNAAADLEGGEAAAGAGGLAEAAGAAGAVFAVAAVAAGVAVKGVQTFLDVSHRLYDQMIALGAAASPVQYELLQDRMNDLQAVVGRVFVPVLEVATGAFQLFGDVMASVLPTTDEARAALEPFNDVLKDAREYAKDLAPTLREAMHWLMAIGGAAAHVFANIFHYVATLAGVRPSKSDSADLTSAFGSAPAQASYSSIEEFGKKNVQQAYSGASKAATMPGDIEAMRKKIEDLYRWFTENPFVQAAQTLMKLVPEGRAGDALKTAGLSEAWRFGRDVMGPWLRSIQ